MKSTETENIYLALLMVAFVAVCAVTAVNHELWRDEANSWLIARESASFLEVFDHVRYKGHPYLWEALLFPVSRISSSPAAMQIFSLMIATAAVWIFLRYSPFSILHKTLFVFGLFPIYEYSVMARPYGLSLLLLFVFCALFRKRNERFLTICLVVALLSNSNAVGFILGAACGGLLLFDVFFANGFRPRGFKKATARQYAGFALVALGTTAGFLSILPGTEGSFFKSDFVSMLKGASNRPSESGAVSATSTESGPKNTNGRAPDAADRLSGLKQTAAYFKSRISKFLTSYSSGLLPVSKPHLKRLLDKESYKNVTGTLRWLSIPFLLLVAYLTFLLYTVIRKSPHAILFWLLATAGLAVLFGFIFYGSPRHHGFFFIVLIMSLWLFRVTGGNPKEKLKSFNTALTVILFLHLPAGATAIIADNHLPFSHGKRTAEFISREIPANTPVFAYPSVFTDAVMVYLEKGAGMFYPEYDRGTGKKTFFYDFAPTTFNFREISRTSALDRARELAGEENQSILLILNRQLDERTARQYGLSEKARFAGAIRRTEDFYLYTMPAPGA